MADLARPKTPLWFKALSKASGLDVPEEGGVLLRLWMPPLAQPSAAGPIRGAPAPRGACCRPGAPAAPAAPGASGRPGAPAAPAAPGASGGTAAAAAGPRGPASCAASAGRRICGPATGAPGAARRGPGRAARRRRPALAAARLGRVTTGTASPGTTTRRKGWRPRASPTTPATPAPPARDARPPRNCAPRLRASFGAPRAPITGPAGDPAQKGGAGGGGRLAGVASAEHLQGGATSPGLRSPWRDTAHRWCWLWFPGRAARARSEAPWAGLGVGRQGPLGPSNGPLPGRAGR